MALFLARTLSGESAEEVTSWSESPVNWTADHVHYAGHICLDRERLARGGKEHSTVHLIESYY